VCILQGRTARQGAGGPAGTRPPAGRGATLPRMAKLYFYY